jgi:hypothetical protein
MGCWKEGREDDVCFRHTKFEECDRLGNGSICLSVLRGRGPEGRFGLLTWIRLQ